MKQEAIIKDNTRPLTIIKVNTAWIWKDYQIVAIPGDTTLSLNSSHAVTSHSFNRSCSCTGTLPKIHWLVAATSSPPNPGEQMAEVVLRMEGIVCLFLCEEKRSNQTCEERGSKLNFGILIPQVVKNKAYNRCQFRLYVGLSQPLAVGRGLLLAPMPISIHSGHSTSQLLCLLTSLFCLIHKTVAPGILPSNPFY